jgi:hypothetical protein
VALAWSVACGGISYVDMDRTNEDGGSPGAGAVVGAGATGGGPGVGAGPAVGGGQAVGGGMTMGRGGQGVGGTFMAGGRMGRGMMGMPPPMGGTAGSSEGGAAGEADGGSAGGGFGGRAAGGFGNAFTGGRPGTAGFGGGSGTGGLGGSGGSGGLSGSGGLGGSAGFGGLGGLSASAGFGGLDTSEEHRLELCQTICDRVATGNGSEGGAGGEGPLNCGDDPGCASQTCMRDGTPPECAAAFTAVLECVAVADQSLLICDVQNVFLEFAAYYGCTSKYVAWVEACN